MPASQVLNSATSFSSVHRTFSTFTPGMAARHLLQRLLNLLQVGGVVGEPIQPTMGAPAGDRVLRRGSGTNVSVSTTVGIVRASRL